VSHPVGHVVTHTIDDAVLHDEENGTQYPQPACAQLPQEQEQEIELKNCTEEPIYTRINMETVLAVAQDIDGKSHMSESRLYVGVV
jgi:hypothetical protein